MKVRYNGQFIDLSSTREYDEMLKLKCACGHSLSSHEFKALPGDGTKFETGACSCGRCKQFRVRAENRSYSYA